MAPKVTNTDLAAQVADLVARCDDLQSQVDGRSMADALWQGALVARWTYLVVDGGRCYLPEVREVYDGQDEHPFSSEQWTFRGLEANAGDVAIARLLNNIVGRPEPGLFGRYMNQARITEMPG